MGENVVRQVPSAEDQLLGLVIAGQLQEGTGTVWLKTSSQTWGEQTGSPVTPSPHLDTQVRVRCRLPTPPQDSGHLPKVPVPATVFCDP